MGYVAYSAPGCLPTLRVKIARQRLRAAFKLFALALGGHN